MVGHRLEISHLSLFLHFSMTLLHDSVKKLARMNKNKTLVRGSYMYVPLEICCFIYMRMGELTSIIFWGRER